MDWGGSEDGGNEKRNDRAAPDSAALIFNDILQRARVPLMHGHSKYASLFSFLLRPMLFPRALPSRFAAVRPDNASLKVSTIRALQFLLLASRPPRKIGRVSALAEGYAPRAEPRDFDARTETIAEKNRCREEG